MRQAPTEAEATLWRLLRGRRFAGFKFRRQLPIGNYIADFACLEHKLIVEIDGSQHIDSVHDLKRDRWLRAQGFRILRIFNNDLADNPDGVGDAVLYALGGSTHDPE